MRGIATALLLLAASQLATAGTFRPAFSFETGGDEDNLAALAFAGDELVVGISTTTWLRPYEFRTGAPGVRLDCTVLTEEEAFDPYCGDPVAASRKIVAAGRAGGADVFRLDGRFVRRLAVEVLLDLAVRGARVLMASLHSTGGV